MPRQRNYAAEYQARQERARSLGVTYAEARYLRSQWPLTQRTQAELRRNHQNVGQMHTQYALIRARIAYREQTAGNRISARQTRTLRSRATAIRAAGPPPTAQLADWYRRAYGNDYNAADFGGISVPIGDRVSGAGLEGEEWLYQPEYEDMYDVGWDDLDQWDVWEILETFES